MKWRRIVGWTLGAIAALLVMAAAGGYSFLKSSAFQQYAIRKVTQATEQATGAPTEIRSLDFNLSTLTAHLYGITLRGTEKPRDQPLLQIDKLTVGLKILSVLHRQVNLSEMIVEHPVARVRVDKAGRNNLPVAPENQNASHANVFDLAVRHAQITQGEIIYDDKETPLAADLYNLGTDIHFDRPETRYRGSISYDSGEVRYGQYAALPHSLQAKFEATPAELTIESAVMKVGNSVASVRGKLSNYADPVVGGDYNIELDARDIAAFAPDYKPLGKVSLVGQLHYANNPNQALLRCIAMDGEIASDALSAVATSGRLSLSRLKGKYRLAKGTLQADGIEFDSLGGRLNADLSVQNLDSTPSGRLRAALHSLSLQAMQRSLGQGVKQVAVSGNISGTADATWKGSISNVVVRSDLSASAAAKVRSTSSDGQVPVDGVIHATYDGARSSLTLRQSTVRIPSATLTADGEVSNRSSLRLQVKVADLHQLESLASEFRTGSAPLPAVSGSASLNATIHGKLKEPQIAGDLSAQNLKLQGSEWKSIQAHVQASPAQIAIANGVLASAQRGRASFSATVALRDWQYLPDNFLRANVSVQQMPIAELQRLANVQYPISGDLSADISLTGSQLDPQGSGKIQVANARAYDEPVEILAAQFHTDHGTILSSLRVALPAGSANADLSYTPRTRAYKLRLDAPSLVLQKLHAVQEKNLALSGTLSASAQGQGTIDDPQLTASLQLPQLAVRDKSISNIKAELNVSHQKADLSLNSEVVDASVQAHAVVNLTGDYQTDASIETTQVPLDVLLATYLPSVPQGFKGLTEFHATLKGPLKDKTKLEAHLTIPIFNATYQSLQIGIAAPIQADFSQSVLRVQPVEIRGTGTSLRLQGNIPIAGGSKPDLTAQGSFDLHILRIFAPDLQSSGSVALDVRASGTAQQPSMSGQLRLQDVAMLSAGAPLGVEKLNGTLDIGNDGIQISRLSGKIGGGDANIGGSITYRPSLQFKLAMQTTGVRLLYPDGLRSKLDSNLTFSGNKVSSTLSGSVLIDSLSFTPDFDLSRFADQFSGDTAVPAQPGFADTVNLGIRVQSKDKISANSSQISLEGRASLQVGGTAANPVITGRTDLTSGELFYRNVRYQLQRGVITFDDPNQTTPVLNVSAKTTVEQYNLTLTLRGPFDKLTTSYTSDPPLSTADIINLIAQGKTTAESAAASQSTDSMIASQAASQFAGGVQKLAGISSLEIDPLIGGDNQNPSARIAIQQRVTRNFLFTFSTDVSQPGSEIVQGEYQISPRWSVSVTRDQVGGVAVDGRLHTRF